MTDREKLVELIQNAVGGCARHWAEIIADSLIINGVTFQSQTEFVLVDVVHGEWVQNKPNPEIMQKFHDLGIGRGMSVNSIYWTCSCCGGWGTLTQKYCSVCGAKMDLKRSDKQCQM